MHDIVNALCPHGRFELPPSASGQLSGLTFAVKDLFDVEGHVTGVGNPRWLETHRPATGTAPSVTSLLAAGARMIGKTITDELAYSVHGDNVHYGTPKNLNAVDRVPGGSSSGSASAIAAGMCDFALGTDTGGSIRVPASYCGIYGIRTTHGVISVEGVWPFMPSFDTVGWFSNDPLIFAAVGDTLLPTSSPDSFTFRRIIFPTDLASICNPNLSRQFELEAKGLSDVFERAETLALAPNGLESWRRTYRTASAYEVWPLHGPWIDIHGSSLGPVIAERFAFAKTVTKEQAECARREQQRIRSHVLGLLGTDFSVVFAVGTRSRSEARCGCPPN